MQTIEWKTQDKSSWPPGPWRGEPDKAQWQDEATGLPCLIVRGPVGAWCGYVGVSKDHPWYRKGYSESRVGPCGDSCDDSDNYAWHYNCSPAGMVEVHGGLTFAGECQEGDVDKAICHVPDPGEPDDIWWFGFDCSHCQDITPIHFSVISFPDARYRTIEYVKAEVRSLARQLANVA